MYTRLMPRAVGIIFTASMLLIAAGRGAYAYIDPGTGSYVLQVVIAGVLAAGFVIKATWRNIIASVGRLFGKRHSDAK